MNENVKDTDITIDPDEIKRFSSLANAWWDPEGDFRPLHQINPIRLEFIRDRLCKHFELDPHQHPSLKGLSILDVGCGGGLISEPLTRMGASVTGIDAAGKNISVARSHAKAAMLNIDYQSLSIEDLTKKNLAFDVVIALEVIEHVVNLDKFLEICVKLAKEGGCLIFATLNRTAKAFTLAILGAEYILRWLPRGTHRWGKFVRPSELDNSLSKNGAIVTDIAGLTYNVLKTEWLLSKDVGVNYMVLAKKKQSNYLFCEETLISSP